MTDPNAGAILILRRTQPWVRLASLVGYLMGALTAFLGLDAALGGLASARFETVPFLLLYALMTMVFLVPASYLSKYSRRIKVFVAQGHSVQLDAALEAQRRFWKFAGVLSLLAFVLLTLVVGFAVA